MKKTDYKKIIWGLALMAIVFASFLAIPKLINFITKATDTSAQSAEGVVINSLSPLAGPVGSVINIYGTGFTPTGNTVKFEDYVVAVADSVVPQDNGIAGEEMIQVTVPDILSPCNLGDQTCSAPSLEVEAGDYEISVTNSRGVSNQEIFTVIDSTPDPTEPINLCSGNANCIQGYKLPNNGIESDQIVRLDTAAQVSTSSTFAFDNLSSGVHTVSVTPPDDWFVGFTLCVNRVDCHDDIPIQGDEVAINFRTNNSAPSVSNGVVSVPAGSYVDLYWHFSQNFDDFGPAPDDLGNSGGGTGTAPPTIGGDSQANAYTGGQSNGGAGLGAGLAQAGKSALGCALSQILNSSIRSALSAAKTGKNIAAGAAAAAVTVPVNESGETKLNARDQTGFQSAQTTAHTGNTVFGVISGPSLDAIAYCLQNAVIKYINQATLQWVKTAFNGNPAFVQNIGQFLTGIGDQAALTFFSQLRGMNPNSPFQASINQAAVQSYNSGFSQQSQYTLGNQMPNGGDKAFLNGDWFAGQVGTAVANAIGSTGLGAGAAAGGGGNGGTSDPRGSGSNWANWYSLTQNPANNPYTQTLITLAYTNEVVATNQANTAATIDGNYLPATKAASVGGKPNTDPSKNKITVPASTIRQTAQKAIDSPLERLISSSKFDQLITQLVNSLIQVALNKIFGN